MSDYITAVWAMRYVILFVAFVLFLTLKMEKWLDVDDE